MTTTKKKSTSQSKLQNKNSSRYKTKLNSQKNTKSITQSKNSSRYKTKLNLQIQNNNYNNYNNIEKQKIVVSYYNDNVNIFHIFVKEIMAIWKYTKGDVNTIIILKNYVNNGLNNWRLNLLRKLYKNIFVNTIPIYINQSNYTINNILQDKNNKLHSTSSSFIKYDKNNDDFVSIFEIMKNFNIISEHKKLTPNSAFKVLYICNSVEQITHSIKYILDTKYQTIKDYDWRMIMPNIKSSSINLINNYDKLLGGFDNTGDITNINNIKWYSDYVKKLWLANSKNNKVLDLIISDGIELDTANTLNSVNSVNNVNSDNLESNILNFQKQILAQAIITIACSSKGGSCCIKNYISYNDEKMYSNNNTNIEQIYEQSGFFISVLYLYYSTFESINLYKPHSSNPESNEFYIVGKGFKEINYKQLEGLFNILKNFKVNHSIIDREHIPESFIKQINIFLKLMAELNSNTIEQENLYLTCFKNKSESITTKNKEQYKKTNKYLECDSVIVKDKSDDILIPKYKEWIKKYNFV